MRVHGKSAKRSHFKGVRASVRNEAVARWHTKNAEEFSPNVQRCAAALATRVLSFRPKVANAWSIALHAPLAQAARPLAGGSPSVVQGEIQERQFQRVFVELWQAGQNRPNALHPRFIELQEQVRPNPSVERTSTGLAHFTPQVYAPLRGPTRFRPAHLKR
jgi:hypothetical protein